MCVFLHLWELSVIFYLFISQSDSNYNLLLGNLAIEVGKYSMEDIIIYWGIIRIAGVCVWEGGRESSSKEVFFISLARHDPVNLYDWEDHASTLQKTSFHYERIHSSTACVRVK